jgi:sulfhydrogenase subunit delta
MRTKKPILGIFSLACCEGCQVELLNLGEKLLKIFDVYKFGYFNWMAEKKWPKKFDIVCIEGTPVTRKHFEHLKNLRRKSRLVVALGNCADLGGIQEIKNYVEKKKDEKLKYVYRQIKGIEAPNVVPVHKVIKIDYRIPTCPINKDEAFRILVSLAVGLSPQIPRRPVCWECQHQGFECLLQKSEPCMGPMTLGGCGAICLRSKIFCYGCRGPIRGQDRNKHLANMEKLVGRKYVREILETFGVEDEVFEECKI